MSAAITLDRVTKRYETVTALSDVSFEVPAGQIMGFLGPNGAGKTTALRILTGLIAATSGSVHVDGLDVSQRPLDVRRRIGYLPEYVALYPELRVREYLAYRAAIKGVLRSARAARVSDVVERCVLGEVERRLIGRLSKGFKQRVALADCLIAQPKIIILDEPTVGLDPHQIRQARELITELGRTATVLLSTHILPEVEMTCQQVTIIDKGRIVAADSPEQLRRRLEGAQVVRVQLRGGPEAFRAPLEQLPGVARVSVQGQTDGFTALEVEARGDADVREAIFQLAVSRGWILRELAPARVSLEDVFIHLTTQEQEG
jgi:ABC-2 type transport system ATP-binding protein